MKKLIFISTLGLFLSACSSDPVKPVNSAAQVKPTEKSESSSKVEKKPEVAPVIAKYADLETAIEANNDDKVKYLASEQLLSNPRDSKALNALAMYYFKKKQYEAATLLLNKSLAVNPKSATAYNNLGLVELEQNNTSEAVNFFRKSLQLDPEKYQAAFNLAAVYAKQKDFNKVIYSLEKAVKAEKADANSLNNYALALVATGKTQEAADLYEKILKINPDHKNTMLNYSVLMIEKQDKFKEGLDLINRLKFVGAENEARPVIKELEIKAKAGLK